jgi:hypothetical protein
MRRNLVPAILILAVLYSLSRLLLAAVPVGCAGATYTPDAVMHCGDGLFYSQGFEQ